MTLRASVTQVAIDVLGLIKTRLELFALEAAGEKARLARLLGLVLAAWLFLTLAILVLSILVGLYFWPAESRYVALALLAALYGGIGVVLLLMVRHLLLNGPAPFSATVVELGQDIEMMAAGSRRQAGAARSGSF